MFTNSNKYAGTCFELKTVITYATCARPPSRNDSDPVCEYLTKRAKARNSDEGIICAPAALDLLGIAKRKIVETAKARSA